jgi:hypothetical protein
MLIIIKVMVQFKSHEGSSEKSAPMIVLSLSTHSDLLEFLWKK